EGLGAASACVQSARVLDVSDRSLQAPAAGKQKLCTQRGRNAAEGSETLVAREDIGLGTRDHGGVEIRLRLRVIAKRRADRPGLADALAPRDFDGMRADAPVVAIEAIVGLQRALRRCEVMAVAREPGDRVAMVRACIDGEGG